MENPVDPVEPPSEPLTPEQRSLASRQAFGELSATEKSKRIAEMFVANLNANTKVGNPKR